MYCPHQHVCITGEHLCEDSKCPLNIEQRKQEHIEHLESLRTLLEQLRNTQNNK